MKKSFIFLLISLITGCKVIDEIKKELYVKINTFPVTNENLGQNIAYLSGEVLDDGGKNITEKGILLSRNPNPTFNDTKLISGYNVSDGSTSNGIGKISVKAENLIVNTTYYYKTYCINSLGTSFGEELNFKTLDYDTPILLNNTLTSAETSIIATCSLINSNLVGNVSISGFYYSQNSGVKETDLFVTSSKTVISNSNTTFSATIPTLTEGTIYYIRAFVKTSKGITLGPENSILTKESTTKVGLKSGLQVYYPFNNNANDESGNNFHGLVNNAILTDDRFGKTNSAYYFNGENNTNIKTNFPGVLGTSPRTFSFWLKRKDAIWNGTSIFSYGNLNTWGQGVNIGLGKNNEIPLILFDNEGSAAGPYFNMVDDKWHHYIITWDKSFGMTANSVKIYIDGKYSQNNWNYNPTTINTIIGTNLIIGQYSPSKMDYRTFLGTIDDLGIWNRVLTETEIQYLYQNNYRP